MLDTYYYKVILNRISFLSIFYIYIYKSYLYYNQYDFFDYIETML